MIHLEANDLPKFQEHLKNLYSAEFYQSSAQQRVKNGWRSNVVVQTEILVGSTTTTRTTHTSAKSPTKQPSPIRSPKRIKNEQKKLSPIVLEPLNKIACSYQPNWENTDVNNEVNNDRQGRTFKVLSITKLSIRI